MLGWMLAPPPSLRLVYRECMGEGGGAVGRERERGREGSASAVVWNHSTFPSHTVRPRDLLCAGPGGGLSFSRQSVDRESGWTLPGRLQLSDLVFVVWVVFKHFFSFLPRPGAPSAYTTITTSTQPSPQAVPSAEDAVGTIHWC